VKVVKAEVREWIQAEGYQKLILLTEDDFSQAGTMSQIVQVGPGSSVKPHFHKKSYEFIYVIEGKAVFKINDKSLQTAPGDMMLTEPGDIHSVENNTSDNWRVIVFKTNAEPDDSYWTG
jgi:quercetin dioxygenase-like cupin family protein